MVKRKKTNKVVNSNCKKAIYKRKYKSKKRGQLKLRNGKPYCIKTNTSSKYINKLRRGTNKKSKKNSRINEVLAGEGESNGDTPKSITINEMTGEKHKIPAEFPLKVKKLKMELSKKGVYGYQLFIEGREEKLTNEETITNGKISLFRFTAIENNDKIKQLVTKWLEDKDQFMEDEDGGKYGHISEWDTSKVTSMQDLFTRIHGGENVTEFNEDISNWNVSNVTNMSAMFAYAENFNQDISKWDVSNVTDMSAMFAYAKKFNANISKWDVSNVEDMESMFHTAVNFNQNISKWKTLKVTNMAAMFYYAEKFNSGISKWDVSKVETMESMFSGAKSFNRDISKWKTSKVTNMESMFKEAESFNKDISGWDVSNVGGQMDDIFKDCKILDENKPQKFIKLK